MNETFRAALIARLQSLTAGLAFDHQPSGAKMPPQIIDTMLPQREPGHQENEEFPYVRMALISGAFAAKKPVPFTVHLVGGVYTSGSIADGVRDITALAMALGGIVEDRSFPPCRLAGEVPFVIGNPEKGFEGLQPHPHYYLTMTLDFTMS